MADLSGYMPIIIGVGIAFLVLFVALPAELKKFYNKVAQGTSLIINTTR
jgi:uncharacterized membrane protein YgaE (UPF0421/DUF939 family)